MKTTLPRAGALVAFLFSAACGPGRLPPPFEPVDLDPPAVQGFSLDGPATLRIGFDEDIEAGSGDAAIIDAAGAEIPLAGASAEGRELVIAAVQAMAPGAEYRLECRVRDAWGNSASFVLPFCGLNENLPALLINEVRTDSSKPRSDMAELYAVTGGSTAGMVLACGVIGDAEWAYRLPAIEIAAGEYIVVHLARPEEPGWTDETGADLSVSAGPDASAEGRDLWYPGSAALSKSTGVLALYGSPTAGIMDAFLYSDRDSSSDEKYGGFGSAKALRRAEAVASGGGWLFPNGPKPEDCASSAGTTETRTICRGSDSADTGTAEDWHVVPTKGASFGRANTDLVNGGGSASFDFADATEYFALDGRRAREAGGAAKGKSMSDEVELTDANFDAEVKNADIPVLVDFWASWCGPCRMIASSIEGIAKDFKGKIKVGKVNVDDQGEVASKFGIVSIPTLMVFKGGQEVAKRVGALSRPDIEAMFKPFV